MLTVLVLIIANMLSKIQQSFQHSTYESHKFSASVLLVISDEAIPKVLLCKRAQHLKSYPGEISFPGGKRENTDTDNVSVALRETFEETGIPEQKVNVIGELSAVSTKSGLKVKPIVGIVPVGLTLIPEEAEVDKLFWVKLSDFHEDNIIPYEIDYKGTQIKTSSFQLEGEIIWGLTARILVSFMNEALSKNIKWKMLMT